MNNMPERDVAAMERMPWWPELYGAIQSRHSARAFDGQKLSAGHTRAIEEACAVAPALAQGARAILLGEARGVFPGWVFKGVPAFLAAIGDAAVPHIDEAVGFLGECVILRAVSLGLGTCWVAGTYNPRQAASLVRLERGERIYAVSPVGYTARPGLAAEFFKIVAGSARRKPIEELLLPESRPIADSPSWMRTALEAARLAPSAMNRQPWRFALEADGIRVAIAAGGGHDTAAKRLDCGIALCHLELGALAAGVHGRWELLEGADVAKFRVPA